MFTLTDEQRQFQESLQRLLRDGYDFDRRRAIAASEAGWSREYWEQLAGLGVLALTLPEAHDGFGGGAVDTYLVMEACGRALLLEPYLATVVMGAGLVARAGSEAQRAAILPAVAAGTRQLAVAVYEPGRRYALDPLVTTAQPLESGGWSLSGAKTHVLNGGSADALIVSARTPRGVSLLRVDAAADGVQRESYAMYDGQRAATIRFDAVRIGADALLGEEGAAAEAIEYAVDAAIAAVCAEAVGAMSALLETTGQYLKTRKQFGVPIGSFQVLQHRMADMLLATEQARSMAQLAASRLADATREERRRIVSAAKVKVSEAARFVGQEAVQLHGGIGVTDELPASHYFRRLTMIEVAFGDVDHHLGALGALLFD
ncbi:MAG: acyl-CoA dehydrogenase [Steroidobacteraceae bacterium]